MSNKISELSKHPEAFEPWGVYNDCDHIDSFDTLKKAVDFMIDNMTSDNKNWSIAFEFDDLYVEFDYIDYEHLIE